MSRGTSAVLLGLAFVASPVVIRRLPLELSYPVKAAAPMILYGGLLVVAGVYASNEKDYLTVLDFYSATGPLLMLFGPFLNYPFGVGFWTTMSYVVAVFFGFPAFLLMKLDPD